MNTTPEKKFIILLGRSGAGKGTQAEIIKKYLEERGHQKVIHLTTGGAFREFSVRDNYTARLMKQSLETGSLMPDNLAIWVWSQMFIDTLTGVETVILEGAPRKMAEYVALKSAIGFYGYGTPLVVYLDVPESWAVDKLIHRGRSDDITEGDRVRKMSWFDTEVLPVIETSMHDPTVAYIHVNGRQSIEEVTQELLEKAGSFL